MDIFAAHRPGTTPVGIGTAVGTEEEQIVLTDLNQALEKEIGMRSLVIIGNRSSKKVLDWFITPRGYKSLRREAQSVSAQSVLNHEG